MRHPLYLSQYGGGVSLLQLRDEDYEDEESKREENGEREKTGKEPPKIKEADKERENGGHSHVLCEAGDEKDRKRVLFPSRWDGPIWVPGWKTVGH